MEEGFVVLLQPAFAYDGDKDVGIGRILPFVGPCGAIGEVVDDLHWVGKVFHEGLAEKLPGIFGVAGKKKIGALIKNGVGVVFRLGVSGQNRVDGTVTDDEIDNGIVFGVVVELHGKCKEQGVLSHIPRF